VPFNHIHLLDIESMSKKDIQAILSAAESFVEISTRKVKKVPILRGKTVINLFFEPSTRTRNSFELAAKRLSADVVNFNRQFSSVVKGETLKDTVLNLDAMQSDAIVIRHPCPGAPRYVSTFCKSHVINAGDGAHEHPTQALLDAFTIKQRKKTLEGLKIVLVGDLLHSRVARSNIFLLNKMGNEIVCVGPPGLLREEFESLGISCDYDLDKAIQDADVVMMLRIQSERQLKNFFPSIREYREIFGLTPARFRRAKRNAIIMHPGPINRGVEMSTDLADSSKSVILSQVENGIAVRMAVLYLLLGGKESETSD
jgi:aspartate carbamoyltransferase catalytic subunit